LVEEVDNSGSVDDAAARRRNPFFFLTINY
jgi:hypothetical protein